MPDARRGDAATLYAVRTLLAVLSPLPWRTRLAAAGRLGRTALARSPRLMARVAANLAHVMPEMAEVDRARIAAEVGDCFGRTALELFASRAFERAHPWNPPRGPGLPAVEAALAEGTGAIVVSGHFGGWEATRAWLKEQGAPCATVYRPLKNKPLDDYYRESVAYTGSPMLPKGRLAVRTLVKHLTKGGFVALLVDQYEHGAPALDFLGRPAPTTLTPAELALKFRLPLIPAYAPRNEDGRIDIWFDAPIAPTTAPEMMQAFNHSLAAQVRARPGQYYWLHRRWEKALPGLAEGKAKRRR
jgi:Kdo2-lipid IVA lauroyltransferase/acyltransferase